MPYLSLPNLGALITLGLGVLALVRPQVTARFVNLRPQGKIGLSELRATYGGLFAALGAFALLHQSPTVFTTLGIAWAGAAMGRLVSILVDGNHSLENIGGVVFEGAIAAFCL